MSAANAPAKPAGPQPARKRPSKRTLQRLRREAGYRSAREFAKELSIPASTYARYERQPETPECAIPMASAWAIADALGVSIDLVVGRADIDAPDPAPVQTRYDHLSKADQQRADEYLDFLELRTAEGRR